MPAAALQAFLGRSWSGFLGVSQIPDSPVINPERHVYRLFVSLQLQWLLETSKALQLSVPLDWRAALGVTPQIVSSDIAQQLGSWIEHRFRQKSWTEYLLGDAPTCVQQGTVAHCPQCFLGIDSTCSGLSCMT